MQYKNTKTGIVIDIESKLSGADWKPLVAKEKQHVPNTEIPKKPVPQGNDEQVLEPESNESEESTGDTDIDSLKVKDIKQELEAMGIEYNPRAKKQELYDLMMGK